MRFEYFPHLVQQLAGAIPWASRWHACGLKRVASVTWNYAAGKEMIGAFREGFEKGGGSVTKEILVPFPNVEFQANLTEIASLQPDAVFAFFAGAGAVKFVKDYAEAGLKARIPLYGAGFLTDGTLRAQGQAAEGVFTTLHYADSLALPANIRFREAFKKSVNRDADVRGAGIRHGKAFDPRHGICERRYRGDKSSDRRDGTSAIR